MYITFSYPEGNPNYWKNRGDWKEGVKYKVVAHKIPSTMNGIELIVADATGVMHYVHTGDSKENKLIHYAGEAVEVFVPTCEEREPLDDVVPDNFMTDPLPEEAFEEVDIEVTETETIISKPKEET